jgi:hypothetical protein
MRFRPKSNTRSYSPEDPLALPQNTVTPHGEPQFFVQDMASSISDGVVNFQNDFSTVDGGIVFNHFPKVYILKSELAGGIGSSGTPKIRKTATKKRSRSTVFLQVRIKLKHPCRGCRYGTNVRKDTR